MLYGSLATRLNPKIFLTCGWTCFHSALRTLTNIYVQSNRQSLELPVWDSQQSAVSWGSELTVNQEMQWDLSKNARGTWSRRVGCFILFPPPPLSLYRFCWLPHWPPYQLIAPCRAELFSVSLVGFKTLFSLCTPPHLPSFSVFTWKGRRGWEYQRKNVHIHTRQMGLFLVVYLEAGLLWNKSLGLFPKCFGLHGALRISGC